MRVLVNTISMFVVALVISTLLVGCTSINNISLESTETTRERQELPEKPASAQVFPVPNASPTTVVNTASIVQPGIYTAQYVSNLPLPTAGYQIYIIGEIHGISEVHQLTIEYLKILYATGLRDIILEESQGYEKAANEFVLKETDILISDLCLRTDVLEAIRVFNQDLPVGEKVRVHLVDLDYSPAAAYAHLVNIHHNLGESAKHIVIPSFSEFQLWGEGEMISLVDRLANVPNGVTFEILQELDTVRDSIHWFHLFTIGDTAPAPPPEAVSIRETRITQNIQYLLAKIKNKPVLALYGAWHAQKNMGGNSLGQTPWAQRLSDDGVDVYSLFAAGMYGTAFWRGKTASPGMHPDELFFPPPEGVSLEFVLSEIPDYKMVYIDLGEDTTSNLLWPWSSGDRASDMYDGIILFREYSPMIDACP